MNQTADTLNVFAEDKSTGNIVHVSEVLRGNACDCICIECGNELQARKGEARRHHFKHITGTECDGETILHKLAKKILVNNRQLALPNQEGYFQYAEVIEECKLESIRPDIILVTTTDKVLIEIAVTSFITEEKLAKIQGQSYNAVEVDFSSLPRECSYLELEKILIDQIDKKEVVNWKGEQLKVEKNSGMTYFLLFLVAIFLSWVGYSKLKNKKFRKRRQRR
ncbi:MAG: hypothetical protein JWQ38_3665 [Flavipsychrobacter sp.]|nr:hypothetical protein [Flavipsychrobacter sp.]